ncbi:ABC transporter ATP-binding protein [Candidatus Woesearchaeota archaeon]|jgi:ABC-2 type transport system ATP-binding protein|nr:ABC transporter ATP-binding protein [Candidatus Woesearchaeota archaeon]
MSKTRRKTSNKPRKKDILIDKLKSLFNPKIKKIPLSAKKIEFGYSGKKVLQNLNLDVKTSQIMAIVGKSGSGKSTFLNLISGALTSNYSGKIKIMNKTRLFSKEDIGFVPQDIAFIPDMSIKENIVFFGSINGLNKKIAIAAGKKLMETLKLDLGLDRLPSEISGGQKVRLNILLSLLHDPNVIILDEPFVGLDYYNRKMLWHFLEAQKNLRKTIILTTHMLVEAEHNSDKIVLLKDGKVFAKGKFNDILKKLKTKFIVEVKIEQINKKNFELLNKYCYNHTISILDHYKNYFMFSVKNAGQRNYLFKFLEKINTGYEELSFREPNLDELFLKVGK